MTCSSLPELEITEWGKSLLDSLQGKRYPLSGMIELTDRCNLSCLHCYINQPAGDKQFRANELSTEQIFHVLDQMAEAGTLLLTLTGGEVLLRADFPAIYRYAKEKGFLVTVFTNAVLVTPAIADLFAELRPMGIEITLYGATRDTYESVTDVPGSFERSKHGIELLVSRNLPVTLKSFLVKQNVHEVWAMKRYALGLGLEFRFDGMILPRLDGNQQPMMHQIPIEEMLRLETDDPDRVNEWKRILGMRKEKAIRGSKVFTCGAGTYSFHVDSQGRMSPCIMVRTPSFDLRKMEFAQAWDELNQITRSVRKKESPCEDCSMGDLCQQCPGWSQTVHGDLETLVDINCKLTQKRLELVQAIVQ